MKKLFNYLKTWDYRIKFLMVGCLNTAVGLGVYWIVLLLFGVNLIQDDVGVVPIIIATVVSQIFGLINSYIWNKFFTYESKTKSKLEVVKFVALYFIVFIIEYVVKLGLNNVPGFNHILIAVITIIITTIISFVGQRYFVFTIKKIKNDTITEANLSKGEITE